MAPGAEAGRAEAAPAAGGRICIVADDLTGAADSGVAFVRPGGEVVLTLDPRRAGCGPGRVTVIDTDTREASPARSGAVVRALGARGGPDDHVLKKIDSLLRGQVATELAALRSEWPGRLVIAAPAVPALGRVTLGGVIRAEPTGLATEACPAGGIRLSARLGVPACMIGLAEVRGPVAALRRALSAAQAAGQLAACDAATDQDLDAIALAGLTLGTPVLWAGAAGLAAALAQALLGPPARWRPESPRAAAPLLIIGSHSPAARTQVRDLLASGSAQGIGLRPGDLLAMPAADRLQLGADLALASADSATVIWLDGQVDHSARAAAASVLGALCAPAVTEARVVITAGGATARAVLAAAGVTALALLGELEPGAVLARAAPAPGGPPRCPLHVITKSGSFGDRATLTRLVTTISQPEGTR
jgi:uncharacterized protein YgbK (DUF1537 family)